MHVVGKIRVEARAGNRALAGQVDRRLAGLFDSDLPERLDACLTGLAGGYALRMDRLELDLGEIPWADFEREFTSRVIAALAERIGAAADPLRGAGGQELQAGETRPDTVSSGLVPERREAWWFYLRHGHLPWWFPPSRWPEIASPLALFREDEAEFLAAFLKLAREFPEAVLRLARHATDSELLEIFGKETEGSRPFGNTRGFESRSAARSAWETITDWLIQRGVHGEGAAPETTAPPAASELPFGTPDHPSVSAPGGLRDRLEGAGADPRQDAGPLPAVTRVDRESHQIGDAGPEHAIAVETAGLILLHPFFGRLFGHLEWLDDTGKLRADRRWHAVQALQWIACGRCGLPEPTLVMEKTLCGIPLHEVAEFPILDGAVTGECEAMVAAAIGHWSVLGKTSVDGLREAFLRRDGLLEWKDRSIHLAVARKPYDLLLDRLPWSLGLVMFAWLAGPIHVRWGREEGR